jgi:hypothetical protein
MPLRNAMIQLNAVARGKKGGAAQCYGGNSTVAQGIGVSVRNAFRENRPLRSLICSVAQRFWWIWCVAQVVSSRFAEERAARRARRA